MGADNRSPQLRISPGAARLAVDAAQWLVGALSGLEGPLVLALSGGATPRRLYETLASDAFSDQIPWARLHLFWGDERFVASDDPRSNYRMANEALLSRAPIPPQNIHRVQTQIGDPEQVAALYESELRRVQASGANRPLLDIALLGLGEDGHTASLFPGSPTLDERDKLVAATRSPDGEARITLTVPAFADARHAAFLAQGSGKSAVLRELLAGNSSLPAARLRARSDVFVFADASAAAGLKGDAPQ